MQMSSASPLIAFVKSGVAGLRPSERRRWEREGTGRNGAGTELDWVKDGNSGSPGRLDSHFVSFVTSRLSSPRGGAVATALCPAPAGPSRGHCPPVTFPWPCRADPSFRRPCAFSSRRDGHAPARWSAGIPHNIPISSSRFLPLPIRKQFVFMFLQITSKFRTPGNKRSFVPSAQSLERAINDAPRPIAPGSGALPARAVRGEARICRAGGDEGLRVCDGTPAERRAGALPSGRSVGAGIPPFSLSGAGLRARHPKNRWLQNTRGSLARAKPMLETPQHSWVCALGKNGGLLSTMGTAEGKTPSRRPGAWHSSRGLLRALRPAEPAARGGCRGRGGGSAPRGGGNAAGCAEAAAAISRRTVPPMESTWNSPGRWGRAGKCSVAVRHRRDEAGLRPPLPWRSRAASEGFGRCGPRSRLPRGGCAARSRAAERPGTGAELHLIGAVVSLTGQSLRNRAKTTEGAERSSSAQVLGRVPEPGILSLALCPSTPRSLRGSASPLRCLQKGQQPFSVPSQAPAGPELCPWGHAASCHLVASGAAGEALPRH